MGEEKVASQAEVNPWAEVERLRAENARISRALEEKESELKEVRGEARDRRHDNKRQLELVEGLRKQVDELTTDRDGWKVKAEATTGDWQSRIDDLAGKLRGMKHDRSFEKVARELKVGDPTKLADLIKLAAHPVEEDEPDEEEITAAFRAVLKGRPWLLDPEPAQPAAGAAPHAPGGTDGAATPHRVGRPGIGADRGDSLSTASRPAKERIPGRF
jgi:hypothetical protein